MLTENEKKQIIHTYLETVEGISDKEYQNRVWIRGEGPECDDFTETTCHFFEEGDAILEKHMDFGISDHQYRVMVELKNQFDQFVKDPNRGYLPQEFIDTLAWENIMTCAREVLQAFNYSK